MGSECGGYCIAGGIIAVAGWCGLELLRRWIVRRIDEGREKRGE